LSVAGYVEEILVTSTATELPCSVERVRAIAGRGLDGDRYAIEAGTWSDYPVQTGTDVTLIEAEVLEVLGLSGAQARRNVVTRGIRLNELVGRRFGIGDVKCFGVRLCEPCKHLEQLTGVAVPLLVHRGGLRADILSEGTITIGLTITVQPAESKSAAPDDRA
jgi:MOSC domain-containing protein YiiM